MVLNLSENSPTLFEPYVWVLQDRSKDLKSKIQSLDTECKHYKTECPEDGFKMGQTKFSNTLGYGSTAHSYSKRQDCLSRKEWLRDTRAGHKVLRAFHVQVAHHIENYASVALIAFTHTKRKTGDSPKRSFQDNFGCPQVDKGKLEAKYPAAGHPNWSNGSTVSFYETKSTHTPRARL